MNRSERTFGHIKKTLAGVVLCKDMLVVAPTGHVLRGFLLETTTERDMVYLWRVVMPLYRSTTRVFLDYSNRVPSGRKVHVDRNALRESADTVRHIVGEHIAFLQNIRTPEEFLRHVSDWIGNSSINFRFDLALTYYLMGEVRQSLQILEQLDVEVDRLERKMQMPIDRMIKRAARVAAADPAGLSSLLDHWEKTNIETLGLQESLAPSALGRTPGSL